MRNVVFVVVLIVTLLSVPAASAAPSANGGTGQEALSQQASDPLQIALDYIRFSAPSFGLTAADVADLIVTDRYVSEHTGVTHIYLRQRYEGIEVVGANININIMPDGSILSMHQSLVPNLAAAVNGKQPALDPVEATASAAEDRGLDEPQDLEVIEEIGGVQQEVVLSDGGISLDPIPAKLVYAIVGPGHVRLSWQVDIYETDAQNYWNLQVDAITGEVLGEANFVSHADDEYTVYEIPKESPNDGARTVAVNPADPVASPFGWHDTNGAAGAEFTITRGNNVHAYLDADNDGTPESGESPDGGALLEFDFPLDLTLAPSTYADASVTNLFYWNNIIHDAFYQYGFDEVSGNFQVNNYGRGGLGGDDVRAEAQDGGGVNNANFFTPPDGQRPRMQMYLWNQTTPGRDGSLDAGIIIHEYAHGISNRLTGGPSNVGCLSNAEQMGEGWSDWLAMVLTTDPADTATMTRGLGNYALGQAQSGGGIRPTPYTTDMTINPTTYGDIGGLAIPHGVGYAWATMLWEMYWELVGTHGYDADVYAADMTAGNQLAIQLVMDGMKLQPCSPGFVDGRDAILAADVALTAGANECDIWEAFAKRGLGVSAIQGSANNTSDGGEAFDMPISCGGVDNTPPFAQILINGGAGVTNDVNVTLNLSATDVNSGVDSYFLADTQLGLDTAAEIDIPDTNNWVDAVPYVLPAGAGVKTVWMRVCDVEGNCGDVSDTILLDPSVFINSTPITFAATSGPGSPYPSTINVSGLVGNVTKVTVSLWSVSHPWPEDFDVLLVGPTGLTLMLMSDPAGSLNDSPSWSALDLTFDDVAGGPLPCTPVVVSSGTYQPTDCPNSYGNDIMPGPAPAGPYGASFAQYLGAVNPNGDWDLYVRDDEDPDSGQIAGGWSLSIEVALSGDSYQGCLYAGSLRQISLLPNGQTPTVACARGIALSLYEGTDYWACLYAGSFSQVGTTQPANCGRGTLVGLWAGTDIWACLYAGALSQVGTTMPTNCGRGTLVGFVQIN